MENIVSEDIEINHKPKAWLISIFLYCCFLAALYFFKIMYTPISDNIALGVDLNYGVDLVGSGNIQTTNKANDSKNDYDVKPQSSNNTAVSNPPPSPPAYSKPITSKTPPVVTADEDSKVYLKKSTDSKNNNSVKPVESNNNTKKTVVSPPSPPAPTRSVDQGSIFKKSSGSTSGSNGTTGTRDGVGGNNNGDGKAGEVGDKGDPRGTLDGKSLYGNPGKGGGSNGASVSISGWRNKGPLNIPKDNSNETGRIKFRVLVDDFGDVVKIDVLETSVSPSITNYYKNQIVSKLKSNLIPEGTPPPRSPGTITINITRGD